MTRRTGDTAVAAVDLARLIEPAELLIYRFGAGTVFERQLVGALERLEAGGMLRVREVLIVSTDEDTGEVSAISLRSGPVALLLGEPGSDEERKAATRRAVTRHGNLVAQLAATLEPAETIAALMIGHNWARLLGDAVARAGGTKLVSAAVTPHALDELTPDLLAATRSRAERVPPCG